MAGSACRVKGIKIVRQVIAQNGSVDCEQIWCVFRDQVATHITQILGAHVRTCARAPLPYLENVW